LANFSQSLQKSKNALIILPATAPVDSVAAGLSLYLSLKQTGKQVIIACSEPVSVALNRLIGVDKITNKIGSRNLVISFDYVQDSIEKVSYHIDGGKFNLVIEPKSDFPSLDSQKVAYSYTGTACDLIIVVGASRLEALGRLYMDEQKIFTQKELVNIDISPFNTRFGRINLLDSASSSISELIGLLTKNLGLPVNADVATDIIAGIEVATNNFSVKTRAETFEIIAWCMASGGRRAQLTTQAPAQTFDSRPFMPGFQPRPTYAPFGIQQAPQAPAPFSRPGPLQTPPFSQPQVQPAPQSAPAKSWLEELNKDESQSANQADNQSAQAQSPDWLKPKIYKGSSQV